MGTTIEVCELPENALLSRYRDKQGHYTDCFCISGPVATFADYVEAFYSSIAFRPERLVLRVIGRGGNDEGARLLATGGSDAFAAWTVEAREENQLLLCDFAGATRSWLMVAPQEQACRFYFGSAVVPTSKGKNGEPKLSLGFHLLLGFHKPYSRVLLDGAIRKLRK